MVAAQSPTTMSQRHPRPPVPARRSCIGCESRANTKDMFGHSKCSLHRPCIGPRFWEPMLCDVCKNLRGELLGMSPEARSERLHSIKIMLIRCRSRIREVFPNRAWEFEPFFSHTFKDFLQTPAEIVQLPQVGAAAQPTLVGAATRPLDTSTQENDAFYDPEDPVEDLPEEVEDFSNSVEPSSNPVNDVSYEDYVQEMFPNEQLSVYNQVLIREECTFDVCLLEAQGQSGQCTNPVHDPPQFRITPRNSLRDNFEQGVPSKRSRSPSSTFRNIPSAQYNMDSPSFRGTPMSRINLPSSTPMSRPALATPFRSLTPGPVHNPIQVNTTGSRTARHHSTAGTSRDHHDSQIIIRDPVLRLPKSQNQPDFSSCKYWTVYDPLLHDRVGLTKMKIKRQDDKTLFIEEQTMHIKYKPGTYELFTISDEKNIEAPFQPHTDSHASIRTGFLLQPSSNSLLDSKSFLDTTISETSRTYHLLLEIQKIEEKIGRSAPYLNLVDLLKQFPDPQFEAFTFLNFTHGFILTQCDFAKFAAKEELSVREFETFLGTPNSRYEIPKVLLSHELVTRQVMLHAIGTIHLQELLAEKVGLIPEDTRSNLNLESDHVLGIASRIMVDIKYHAVHWIMAKMSVRRFLLQNTRDSSNFDLLSSSLWNNNIFPKEAFTKLRGHHNNILDLSKVLKIDAKAISSKPANPGTKSVETIHFDRGFNNPNSRPNTNSDFASQRQPKKQKTSNTQTKSGRIFNRPQPGNRNPQQGWQNKPKNIPSGNKNQNPPQPKAKQGKGFQKKDNPKDKQ